MTSLPCSFFFLFLWFDLFCILFEMFWKLLHLLPEFLQSGLVCRTVVRFVRNGVTTSSLPSFFFLFSPEGNKEKEEEEKFFFSFIWFTTAATYYWRVYVMFAMSILGLANAHRKDVEKRFPPPYSSCCFCCCCWPFWLYKTETSGHDLLFVFCFV